MARGLARCRLSLSFAPLIRSLTSCRQNRCRSRPEDDHRDSGTGRSGTGSWVCTRLAGRPPHRLDGIDHPLLGLQRRAAGGLGVDLGPGRLHAWHRVDGAASGSRAPAPLAMPKTASNRPTSAPLSMEKRMMRSNMIVSRRQCACSAAFLPASAFSTKLPAAQRWHRPPGRPDLASVPSPRPVCTGRRATKPSPVRTNTTLRPSTPGSHRQHGGKRDSRSRPRSPSPRHSRRGRAALGVLAALRRAGPTPMRAPT